MTSTASNLTDLYKDKGHQYFTGARNDIIALLPRTKPLNILEVGCGDGSTGAAAIAQASVARYDGVELDAGAAKLAEDKLTSVTLANAEHLDLATLGHRYDVLIMSEVLEHLVDPWLFLKRATAILNDGATIYASSPNVASLKVVKSLLKGRFDYQPSGTMDRTHLRWFTPSTYREMFESVGFTTIEARPLGALGPKGRILDMLSGGRLRHLLHGQTMYIGRYSRPQG